MNLSGQTFHNLTVIDFAEKPSHIKGRGKYYICKCKCGTVKVLNGSELKAGKIKSCSCLGVQKFITKNKDLIGTKHNNLLILDFKNKEFICQCDCNNKITVPYKKIIKNKIKSCGQCLNNLIGKKFNALTVLNIIKKHRVFLECLCDCGKTILTSYSRLLKEQKSCGCRIDFSKNYRLKSAKNLFKVRYYLDGMSFDEFYKLSQQNCFYCGLSAEKSFNISNSYKNRKISEAIKTAGKFKYHGLDRVNSNLLHTIDNVVTCCIMCNRAKLDRSPLEFQKYINNLPNEINFNVNNILINKNENINNQLKKLFPAKRGQINLMLQKIKDIERKSNKRKIFYNISTIQCAEFIISPCAYCGTIPNNNLGKYNGIDRINNDIGYELNNCIPCCKYCNASKNNFTIEQFNSWRIRVKNYQALNNSIESLI